MERTPVPVTQWFIIKSLTVPSSWIALLIAFIITGLIVWKRFGKHAENVYSDAVILFIVVWKLSVVITDFDLVVDSPMMIFYFNGGETGFYLGLAAAIIRMFFFLKKRQFHEQDLIITLFSITLIQCIYQILMVFLNNGTTLQGFMTYIIFLLMGFGVWRYSSYGTIWRIQLTVLFVFAHILASIIQPEGFFQTSMMATIICMAFIIPILLLQLKQNRHSEESL